MTHSPSKHVFFATESGSEYEIRDGMVRRTNSGHVKRRDGDWLVLRGLYPPEPAVGVRMVMLLESLAAFGPDDFGTVVPDSVTTRTTSVVTHVWPAALSDVKEEAEMSNQTTNPNRRTS